MKKLFVVLAAALCLGLALGGPPAAAKKKPKRTFLYLFEPDRLRAWELVNGLLEPASPPFVITGASSFLGDGDHQSLSYDGKQKQLVVAGNGGIRAIPIGKGGEMDGASPLPVEFGFTGVATVKRGDRVFVYSARPFSNELMGFKLSKKSEFTPLDGFPMSTVTKPQGVAVLGKTLFVAGENDGTDGTLAAYAIGKKGDLTELEGSPFTDLDGVVSVWPDPQAEVVYVPNVTGTGIFGFRVTDNGLEEVAGSPYASSVIPGLGMAIGPGDLHFSIGPSGLIQAFRRQADDSLVQVGNPHQGPNADPDCAAQSPDGSFLVVVTGAQDTMRLYSVDKTTGGLNQVDSETINMDSGMKSAVFVQL